MPKLGMNHFKKKLGEHLNFLRRSCALYDQGYHDESIRMATSLRVLFHHTSKSTSLLNHLKQPDIGMFSQGGLYRPGAILYDRFGLYGGEHVRRETPGSGMGIVIPASYWWGDVILIHRGMEFTRKDFVLTIANKDGGAHVDDHIPANYDYIISKGVYRNHLKDGLIGFSIGATGPEGGAGGTPFLESHWVAVRHIASEVLRSPGLIALGTGANPSPRRL